MRLFALLLLLPWTLGWAGPSLLISTDELAAALAQGRVSLVDAESPESYARAHLPGALNLPYLELEDAEENAKTGLPIFPRLAASKLEALGYFSHQRGGRIRCRRRPRRFGGVVHPRLHRP